MVCPLPGGHKTFPEPRRLSPARRADTLRAMNRDQAMQLLNEYVSSEQLIKHSLAVEAAMRYHAGRLGEDVERWGVVGLLHDFDYQRWPTKPEHSQKAAEILRQRGVDEEIVGAILSHTGWNEGYPRDTLLRKVLFAVDELSGFLVACTLVRPTRLEGMSRKSVIKKLKERSFAANVSREDIHAGAELLDMPLGELIDHGIEALKPAAEPLGLTPPAGER